MTEVLLMCITQKPLTAPTVFHRFRGLAKSTHELDIEVTADTQLLLFANSSDCSRHNVAKTGLLVLTKP